MLDLASHSPKQAAAGACSADTQERLFDEISAALETTETPAPSSTPKATRKGHWKRVWDAAKGIFRTSSGAGGSEGPSIWEGVSDAQLQMSLAQLHMYIQDSMAAEVPPPSPPCQA